MENLDKKILIKELTARLSYGVKFFAQSEGQVYTAYKMCPENEWVIGYDAKDDIRWYNVEEVTLYLRPMESITAEELYEIQEMIGEDIEYHDGFISFSSIRTLSYLELCEIFDWFNAHHFDYRGLIKKGLAFEAPEGMYV